MSEYCFIKTKMDDQVMDIHGASTASGVLLDAYPQKATNNDNQQWEFVPDPTGSGYYFIKSKLDDHVIDVQRASTASGALLDAFACKTSDNDNQLWGFVEHPAVRGYYFIKSKLDGKVIDIEHASTKSGVHLDVFPQKTKNNDNQLWTAVDGEFPTPPKILSNLTWTGLGTGPEPNTTGGGENECNYTVNLSIQQDGTCRFWGDYTNRGTVPVITAPAQTFGVAIVVHDMNGKGYSFGFGGHIPSAPQPGGMVKWDKTSKSPAIADNWLSIALRCQASYSYDNSVSASDLWGEIGGAVATAVSDIGTAVTLPPMWRGPDRMPFRCSSRR